MPDLQQHHTETEATDQPGKYRWLGLVCLTLGVAMIIVDSTVVNVAIPSMIRDLGLSLTQAQWANTVYSLVFAACMITFGRMADQLGRRRVFIAGICVFLLASLCAGLAVNGASLIAARLLQGIGGAMILPASLSTLNATFHGRERAMAFGVWGSVIGGAVALGPLVGGWSTTNLSWRWAFFVNLPVGVAAIVGVLRWVRESREQRRTPGGDLLGVVTLSLGLALLVFATIEGNTYGWWAQRAPFQLGGWQWPRSAVSVIPWAYAGSVCSLAACAVIERSRQRRGASVVFDFTLYRLASFRNGNFAAMIVSLGELGMVFVLPLYLQTVLGYEAVDTGVLLLALSGGAFLAGGAAARISIAYGARTVVVLGFALEVVGILSLGAVVGTDTSGWAMAPFLLVYGMGVGFATAQLTSIILRDVPIDLSGQASGMQSTVRQIGAAMGIAVLGSVFVVLLIFGARDRLANADSVTASDRQRIVRSIERTGGAVTGIKDIDGKLARHAAQHAVDEAFVRAARWTAWGAAGFVALGLLAALRLPAVDPTRRS